MIKKIVWIIKKNNLRNILRVIFKDSIQIKTLTFKFCKDLISNKNGLEIGGPSKIFSKKGIIPVYPIIKSLDNCNFSSDTIWEGQIKNGFTFKFDENKTNGYQFVLDSTNLDGINADKYDFIISSHVIEHIANPIKALNEWVRVLKKDGIMILILPHKDGTFDHKRIPTSLNHIIDDYKNNISEDDQTHLNEILEFHDLAKDSSAGSFENFKLRSLNNYENRCLHHHVFNTISAIELINYLELQIINVEVVYPCHIIIIAQKSHSCNNQELINRVKNYKFKSPFKSDYL